MPEIALLSSTGAARADEIIRDVVDAVGPAFPDRVRGYYLVGSYATGETVATSDIDLIVLFKGSLEPGERERFAEVREQCRRAGALALDLSPESEDKLFRVGGVWFQTASVLMYGEDVRARVPRKPVESHARDLMHSLFPLLARVRGSPEALHYPLDYPDPTGALYGYDYRYLGEDLPRRTVTKDLVTNVLAAANALTLYKAKQYVGSGKKRDIPEQYRRWVAGKWVALVEDVFECCRLRWGYLAPEPAADRERLRDLCRQALAFENHFLARYRDFLLAELRGRDPAAQLLAARRCSQVIFADAAIVAALAEARARGSEQLRQAAADALRRNKAFTSS
jgi:hypothetical protein